MSVQHNVVILYLKLISAIGAIYLQIYLGTSSLKRANRLCCEKLGTSHHVKGFAIGSFLERIVVERAKLMMTSVRKTLKRLV